MSAFTVLIADLTTGASRREALFAPETELGGSGLAAALYEKFVRPDLAHDDPAQPLIFAIGPLTGWFPLMSKTVCAFRSPYHGHYAESHAGGRLALSLRFSGLDAVVLTGRAERLSALEIGRERFKLHDVRYLRGADVFATGKHMRRVVPGMGGRRSIIRIGPAGETGCAYACVNVDTYRHFGRLGAGAVMGAKNLKAMVVHGDGNLNLPDNPAYAKVFKETYADMTGSGMMRKYHDLGTPENLKVLNTVKSLPWDNLQRTHRDDMGEITGETLAEKFLLRKTACSGCPVGCIHVGLLREKFASENEYLYRQVAYDHEPIFACGTMLGMTRAADALAVLDEAERGGLDAISSGVALAWAAEATQKGIIGEKETLDRLAFGEAAGFRKAMQHLAEGANDFYRTLARGAEHAAKAYGGADFACVLGQEMAGYATGAAYFASQTLGLRHSHLDVGGYSFDQKDTARNPEATVKFFLDDEKKRVQLTCMVSCLFARQVYSDERVAACLSSLGFDDAAANLDGLAEAARRKRWRVKMLTGHDPATLAVPKRFTEVVTVNGPLDQGYMSELMTRYRAEIERMSAPAKDAPA